MFPLANESAQVRLTADKTQRLDAIHTTENGGCGRDDEERKYSPSAVKHQLDKIRSRMRENLSLTCSRFGALKERLRMKGDEELTCFLLDR